MDKMTSDGAVIVAGLGFGGNLGDAKQNLIDAINFIGQSEDITLLMVSKLYQTPPWGKLDQPPFLNACLLIKTTLSARALLSACLAIEDKLGRVRTERWGPRLIDVDVLYYSDQAIDEEGLQIPHPRMTDRAFVMVPLSDIDPLKMLNGKSIEVWVESLDAEGIEPLSNDGNWHVS
jgi:2-amino-4-hydroxy-6-hydroxymethyldihydropteridine diphosphokinase